MEQAVAFDESEREEEGLVTRATACEWSSADGRFVDESALPSDKATPILVHCRSGGRASAAVPFLKEKAREAVERSRCAAREAAERVVREAAEREAAA